MKTTCYATLIGLIAASSVFANLGGAISTDRFGYTGTVLKYNTLEDAKSGQNLQQTIAISDRDLSLFVVDNLGSYYNNASIIMGSWWYTTHASGSAGWGNTRGNTGVGFVQLYETDPSALTRDNVSMGFSDFDGTYWTTFNFSLSGTNASYATSYARFSTSTNTGDRGVYHEYNLQLTATGLEGVKTGSLIEASTHPTNVSGSYTGIFENQGTAPGFYVFALDLNMTNWAYENRNSLTGQYQFEDSYFAAVVPAPGAALLAFFGLGIVGWVKRRMA